MTIKRLMLHQFVREAMRTYAAVFLVSLGVVELVFLQPIFKHGLERTR